MSLPYGPPLPVSPLIRGIRWGLFFAGIIYARGKQKVYNGMEAYEREQEEIRKAHREIEMAKIRARIAAEEKEAVRLLEQGKLFD